MATKPTTNLVKPTTNLDFTNFFATNSTLNPYTWLATDYLKGWQMVGSTPPARTQFDALQRTTDQKLKYLLDLGNYLGDYETFLKNYADYLDGRDAEIERKAAAAQRAADDAQNTADGIIGITSATVQRNGYARFKNGLLLQWGRSANGAVTFPVSFSATDSYVWIPFHRTIYDFKILIVQDSQSQSSITFKCWDFDNEEYKTGGEAYCDWIAIGK